MSRQTLRLAPICATLIIGGVGCTHEAREIVNARPTAAFVYNPVSPILAGSTVVVFNASPSRDIDGTIASYSWDFGDGTSQQTLTTQTLTHVFSTTGTCIQVAYAVLLTVVDDVGARDSVSENVKVTEPCPLPSH